MRSRRRSKVSPARWMVRLASVSTTSKSSASGFVVEPLGDEAGEALGFKLEIAARHAGAERGAEGFRENAVDGAWRRMHAVRSVWRAWRSLRERRPCGGPAQIA